MFARVLSKGFAAAVAAAAISAAASPASAATQVYFADPGLGGNQAWSGTLGLDFDVLAPILVSQIGAFDSEGNGITGSIFVTIRDEQGNNLFAPVDFGGSTNATNAAYVLRNITAIRLNPGRYQVAAWQYNSIDPNYNNSGPGGPIQFDNLGGRLSAVGTRYSSTPGGITDQPDVGATRYGAGTFVAAAVPEPATWALMIAGFGSAGAMLRRRRAVGAAH